MKDYYTIGIVFEPSNTKQYTYKVPISLTLAIDDYIAVAAPGLKVVQVKSIHKEPKDTEGYEYKFISGTVIILPKEGA